MQDGIRTVLAVIVALMPALGLTVYLFACAHERGHLVVTRSAGRVAAFCARLVAFAPIASFVGLALFVALAWCRHGTFPRPIEYRWNPGFGDIDVTGGPRASDFEPGPTLLLTLLFASGLSILLMPGLCALSRAVGIPTAKRTQAMFYSSWALLLIAAFTDPLDLLSWAFGD